MKSPIPMDVIENLHVSENVLISGVIYVARDAAHLRLIRSLDKNEALPFDIAGQTVYYMGPSPAALGQVIGACGPTTSSRMDMFTPRLLSSGLRAMIGKGDRSPAVREAIQKYRAVYFVATGGAGALLSQSVKKMATVAYPDLGAEAVLRLVVADFPAIVAYDARGGDVFAEGKARYRRESH
ncbi:MAG: FumA C-terminus/TtdB family hydratase beta subunit [Chloroflexota bacterium]